MKRFFIYSVLILTVSCQKKNELLVPHRKEILEYADEGPLEKEIIIINYNSCLQCVEDAEKFMKINM